ncbi:hypothetical protein [Wolbachia endosymbiont (group A) of Lasioglossum fulvicorne]|uniref:hypothetical protein n=1 Tax=Wolbachia endosymbiont (group A) of Lasioglossum fulvicorne TaxID=3066201 RepID=UPI00334083BE
MLYFIIREMMNKNNVPYYIAGTLATFTLLASGVFAAAPYIGFLAPVAALSVGLPFIIGYAVFSVVTIALSYKAISKNKTNFELKNQVQTQKQENSEKDTQLAEKEAEVKAKEEENSELKSKVKAQEEENSEQKTQLAEKNKKIEEDKLKVAIADGTVQLAKGTVNSAVWFEKEAVNGVLYSGKYAYDNYVPSTESTKGTLSGIGGGLKNTCDTSIESAKGTISSAGNKLKNVYDTMPSTESVKGALGSIGSSLKNACGTSVRYVGEKLNSVGSSLYSRIYGTKVSSKEKFESRIVQRKQEEAKARTELKASGLLPNVIELQYKISSPEEQFKREDGSKPSMQELTRLDYLDLAVPSSEQKQRANSLDYLNIDNVPKQPDHLNVDAAKSDLMSLSEDQDVFYDAESGDEKDTETPSPESQPAEKEETKVNGYLDQAVSTVNYFVHQAAKATPYLAATCLP